MQLCWCCNPQFFPHFYRTGIHHSRDSMTICVPVAPRSKIPGSLQNLDSNTQVLVKHPPCNTPWAPPLWMHTNLNLWSCPHDIQTLCNGGCILPSFQLAINFHSFSSNIQVITCCCFFLLNGSQVHPPSPLHPHCHDSRWGHHSLSLSLSKMFPKLSPFHHIALSIHFSDIEVEVMPFKAKLVTTHHCVNSLVPPIALEIQS